jgi:hypothetical protein
MSRITDFYSGTLKHPRGVTIDAIWQWNAGQLEYEHTYIQWLFPLPEMSVAVPDSPILSTKDMERFKASPELRARLLKSFRLLLGFYGFALRYGPEQPDQPTIEPTDAFAERARRWLTTGNHNYLRITRILRSLTLLGLQREASEFFAVLQRVYLKNPDRIGPVSYEYWKNAIRD